MHTFHEGISKDIIMYSSVYGASIITQVTLHLYEMLGLVRLQSENVVFADASVVFHINSVHWDKQKTFDLSTYFIKSCISSYNPCAVHRGLTTFINTADFILGNTKQLKAKMTQIFLYHERWGLRRVEHSTRYDYCGLDLFIHVRVTLSILFWLITGKGKKKRELSVKYLPSEGLHSHPLHSSLRHDWWLCCMALNFSINSYWSDVTFGHHCKTGTSTGGAT